jgi:hypothetical protein
MQSDIRLNVFRIEKTQVDLQQNHKERLQQELFPQRKKLKADIALQTKYALEWGKSDY